MYSSARMVYTGHDNDSVTVEELNEKVFYQLHIPAVIFVSLCLFVGVIGNLLVLTIYKTRFRRSNHRYFILFLGVTDLCACVTGMPFLLASLRFPYMMTSVIACKVLRSIHYAVNNSSGILLVVIAIERYRKICRPFKKQFSHSQTLYLCIGTVVFSVLVAIPSAVFYGNNTIETGIGNITGTQCYVADSFAGNRYFEMYMAALLLETFICIIIFAVLYAFIIRKLWASDQFIETMRSIKSVGRKDGKKDQIHSTDELNSIEDSLDSRFDSVYEPNNHGLDKFRELHTSHRTLQQASQSSSNLVSSTEQVNTSVNDTHSKNGNSKAILAISEYSKGSDQRRRSALVYSEIKDPRERPTSARLSLAIPKRNIDTNTDSSLANSGNTSARSGLVSSLSPIQKQVYEQLLAKQTLEKGAKRNATKSKNKNSKTTARVTVMLFTVTLAFVLAFVPHLTLMLLTIEVEGFVNDMTVTQVMVYHVFLRIFIINNIVNPVVYLIFDKKFRSLCRAVFSRCCRTKT